MRLNLVNCTFGVKANIFLYLYLIESGTEANTYKCEAVIQVDATMIKKKVMKLNTMLTILSWFISKST